MTAGFNLRDLCMNTVYSLSETARRSKNTRASCVLRIPGSVSTFLRVGKTRFFTLRGSEWQTPGVILNDEVKDL